SKHAQIERLIVLAATLIRRIAPTPSRNAKQNPQSNREILFRQVKIRTCRRKVLTNPILGSAITFCRPLNNMKKILVGLAAICCTFLLFLQILRGQRSAGGKRQIPLPSSKVLSEPVPGEVQRTNSFPGAMAISADSRYIA